MSPTPHSHSMLMARFRSKDTAPELAVRRLLHSKGFRFRLHQRHLPGKPDLVFPARKCIVLVHGCFWHRHGCAISTTPKTNTAFWEEKLKANVVRDAKNLLLLRELGWRVRVVWECETRAPNLTKLVNELRDFLAAPSSPGPSSCASSSPQGVSQGTE